MYMSKNEIDQYIERFSGEKQEKLIELRRLIKTKFPDLEERISYAMPSYRFYGSVVHFEPHQLHFGLYPGPEAIKAYVKDLEHYETSKGAIKFPYGEPLPLDIISKLIKYNMETNRKKKSSNVIDFPGGE